MARTPPTISDLVLKKANIYIPAKIWCQPSPKRRQKTMHWESKTHRESIYIDQKALSTLAFIISLLTFFKVLRRLFISSVLPTQSFRKKELSHKITQLPGAVPDFIDLGLYYAYLIYTHYICMYTTLTLSQLA